ncbi:MAG: DUF4163 domain-containing protein [Sporomusaceae bacterium]|nr:DUF4163 domain-containing protein [Sporomusaceae bacterium]
MNTSFIKNLSKQQIMLAVCMIIGITIASGYYFYWMRTPEYSLKLIQESLKNHDLDQFKKHVDIDSLLSQTIDDVLEEAGKNKNDNDVFMSGLAQLVKPNIIAVVKEKVFYFVENGNDRKKEASKSQAGSSLSNKDKKDAFTNQTVDKIFDYQSLEFQGIDYTRKEGKVATVGLGLKYKQSAEKITLEIKMRELQDGTWQVMELVNLRDVLKQIDKAKYAYYSTHPSSSKAIQVTDQEYKDEICTLAYPKVDITENRQAEEKINGVIQDRVDKAIEAGKKLSKMEKSRFGAYSVKLSYKVSVNDDKLYSIVIERYSYTGGAHGMLSKEGLVFDAKTGEVLKWSDMYPSIDEQRRSAMNQSIVKQSLEDRKKDIFKPFKGVNVDKGLNFYVNDSYKPVLIFQPYEIGPFSSGALEFEMPQTVYGFE